MGDFWTEEGGVFDGEGEVLVDVLAGCEVREGEVVEDNF
jgi:hypothetical protein